MLYTRLRLHTQKSRGNQPPPESSWWTENSGFCWIFNQKPLSTWISNWTKYWDCSLLGLEQRLLCLDWAGEHICRRPHWKWRAGTHGPQGLATTAAVFWGEKNQKVLAIATFLSLTHVLLSLPLYLPWGWHTLTKMWEFEFFLLLFPSLEAHCGLWISF